MYRLAILCLLLAGCSSVQASTIKIHRAKSTKKPATVQVSKTAAGDLATTPKDRDVAPAAAPDPIADAARKAKQKKASEFDKRVIKILEGDEPSPIPPPGPPGPPPSPPPSPPPAPVLTLPATIEGNVGSFIEVVPQTNLKSVHFYVIDKGLNKLPDSVALASPTVTVVQSMAAGQYRMIAVGADGDEVVGPVEFMVVVHGPQPPPNPNPNPNPNPQPNPNPNPQPAPHPTASKLFVVVVDNIATRDPRTTAIVTDRAFWNTLVGPGMFLNLNTTDANAQQYKPMVQANGGVPAIILLDGTNYIPGKSQSLPWLNRQPQDLRLPTTEAGVQALINRYMGRS